LKHGLLDRKDEEGNNEFGFEDGHIFGIKGAATAANLIDEHADKVNANYESCHVGETIIPALKEETHVQQAASYASDSAARYCLKGVANNNYKLSG
jgi:hypothetical protein